VLPSSSVGEAPGGDPQHILDDMPVPGSAIGSFRPEANGEKWLSVVVVQ